MDDYLRQVEKALHTTRTISEQLCKDFYNLPLESQAVFAEAIAFAGCKDIKVPSAPEGMIVHEAVRIRAARLMLLRLYADINKPRWSSWLLECIWNGVMTVPGGEVTDLFLALFELLEDFACELTEVLTNFIKDITVQGFTRYRTRYEAADFSGIVAKLSDKLTGAQAYLGMLAIPPRYVSPQLRLAILQSLAGTAFKNMALSHFEMEDIDTK